MVAAFTAEQRPLSRQFARPFSPEYPVLVITDLVMPEKEGIEVIMELQKQNPKPFIIAMSGGGKLRSEAYLPTAKLLGADSIMQKPFLTSELLDSVRYFLVNSSNPINSM